jgi:small redox-active disulfide protein 2
MKIIVAGPGCQRCQITERNVVNACAELDIPADITHIFDVLEFSRYGVRTTPAVIIDGKVVLSGKVPTVDEIKEAITSQLHAWEPL